MKKSPLSLVKEKFGEKEKLVDALLAMPSSIVERGEDQDAARKTLLSAANSKLLRMHNTGSAVAKRFGSKDKLVDAILTLQKRGKDADYRNSLGNVSVGKLYDRLTVLERGARRDAAAAKA